MIVVDANVVIDLLLDVDSGRDSEELFTRDPDWVAPRLLSSELNNVLVGFARRNLLEPAAAAEVIGDAEAIFDGRLVEVSASAAMAAALESGLSAYDAEYVVAARALGVRLATRDGKILRTAPDVAVAPAAA
ncbi:MAG: type II toxin-antitoxin system VapC family toxin [Chloroflexi bacterium]|nr:type II toxin-antitoxin system VapC family toxin [Chloroflexota bacterium]MXX65720.1 type II toxin-antitoxin system VapC family toxin [Chloroflexota bacterium]MYB15966.1 type II toxin-antitoxin system VapC family toxin [Chloroflexota bacterium]